MSPKNDPKKNSKRKKNKKKKHGKPQKQLPAQIKPSKLSEAGVSPLDLRNTGQVDGFEFLSTKSVSPFVNTNVASPFVNTNVASPFVNTNVASPFVNTNVASAFVNTNVASAFVNTDLASPFLNASVASPYQRFFESTDLILGSSATALRINSSAFAQFSVSDSLALTTRTFQPAVTGFVSANSMATAYGNIAGSLTIQPSPSYSGLGVPYADILQLTKPYSIVNPAKDYSTMRVFQSEYATLAGSLISASSIQGSLAYSLEAGTLGSKTDFVSSALPRLQSLTLNVSGVYDSFASIPHVLQDMPSALRDAPAIGLYASSRAVEVAAQSGGVVGSIAEDSNAEAFLEDTGGGLEARLASLNRSLVGPYLGMRAAAETRGPDWARHFATSLRELMRFLLRELAPDQELPSYFPNPSPNEYSQGQWTRRAELRFIFKDVDEGPFSRMVDEMINISLAIFFPADAGVHTLDPSLTEAQARVLLHQAEGSVSTILAASGY